MNPIIKLIIPERSEIILYSSFSLFLLLVQNVKRFQLIFKGETVAIANKTEPTANFFKSLLEDVEQKINPRIIDFLLWIIIGSILFFLISLMVAVIKSAHDEIEVLHYYKNPKNKAHEIHILLTKLAIRLISLIGLIIWMSIFLKTVNPNLVNQFFALVIDLKDPLSWVWLPLTVAAYSICLYLFAILLRLIALKQRIIWDKPEE
jgi:hypothetical protein